MRIFSSLDHYSTVDHTLEGLHLEANEHHESIFRPPTTLEVGRLNHYPDSACTRLAESLAAFLGVLPHQLYFTNGSIEAIEGIVARAVYRGATTMGLIQPSYDLYSALALRTGMDIKVAEIDPDDAKTQLYHWEHYASTIGSANFCIIGSPNNPTGTSLDYFAAADMLTSYSGEVVVDEAYIEYGDYNESLVRFTSENPRLIIVRTFSKAWGLAAIRLGYIIGHPDIISELNRLSRPYMISSLVQEIALAALANSSAMLESVKRNNQLRAKTARYLRRFEDMAVFETKANFILVTYKYASSLWHFLSARGIYVKLLGPANTVLRISVPNEMGFARLTDAVREFFEESSESFK